MRLPAVRSDANPDAPPWTSAEFETQLEYEQFKHSLAAIVGFDDRDGTYHMCGTGTIIGSALDLYVGTVSHVLTSFANSRYGALQSNPVFGPNDLMQREHERLKKLIKERVFKVIVETTEHSPLKVLDVYQAIGGDEMQADCAFLICDVPEKTLVFDERHFAPNIMDFEDPLPDESLLMVGFIKPSTVADGQPFCIPISEVDRFREFRANVVARVSRVVESTTTPPWGRPGLLRWRVAMPSINSMSGGPLLRMRGYKGRRPRIMGESVFYTTVGLVSRHAWGDPLTEGGESEEHTWITPIRTLPMISGPVQEVVLNYRDCKKYLDRLPLITNGKKPKIPLIKLLSEKKVRLKKQAKLEALRASFEQSRHEPGDLVELSKDATP